MRRRPGRASLETRLIRWMVGAAGHGSRMRLLSRISARRSAMRGGRVRTRHVFDQGELLVAVLELAMADDQPPLAGGQARQTVEVAVPGLVIDDLPVLRRGVVRQPDDLVRRDAGPPAHGTPQLVANLVLDGTAQVDPQGVGMLRLEPLEPLERTMQRVLDQIKASRTGRPDDSSAASHRRAGA